MKLLKEAKTKNFKTTYSVKLFDEENGIFCGYANNSNFDWGHTAIYNTKKEAEEDFYNTIKLYDFYKWEIK